MSKDGRREMSVANSIELPLRCDGCGQKASEEHLTRGLRRLEWATRYRPVHIHTLLLGGFFPRGGSGGASCHRDCDRGENCKYRAWRVANRGILFGARFGMPVGRWGGHG